MKSVLRLSPVGCFVGLGALVVVASGETVRAQSPSGTNEWAQWGGPTRDFRVESLPLAETWPETGPPVLWRRPLGEGYSAIVVTGDTLVTMYRDGDDEVVVALDAATGDTRWTHAYHAPLVHDGYFDVWLNSAGPGPYSTPLVLNPTPDGVSSTVVALGVNGHLHALDVETGDVRWSHNLVERFAVSDYNAFASSPLVYGDSVIVPLGGSGHGVVALDSGTGSVAWRSDDFSLAPGSPVVIRVDGDDQLVVLGQQEVVGLDPTTGARLWAHPHQNQLGLNITVPVWNGDGLLFVTSAYDGGSRLLRVTHVDGRTTVDEQWSTNRMRVHFSNALLVGTLVIGSSGDFGPAFLTALDITTGEEVWRERDFARAHVLAADDKLILLDEDGGLAIASLGPEGLGVQSRYDLLTENAWTPPTLVGDTLYVRDRHHILALHLGRR